ncbi:tim44-like domain-containing protein [Ophiocordyceps camponoti-floridani]|uniref:Tim44-like domain-containing protein n=1 Tax=Ophiocordyceps camponoti-floridani TaxID=2030778 RepID=A0A8H4Q2P7_9HYPO|nr:tim44-like domain-containing protein [Ophiocordyceps camponoti-floridani]
MNDNASSSAARYREALATLKERGGPLTPGTFVSLPFSEYPRPLSRAWQYQIARLRAYVTEISSLLMFKLSSMPSWTQRPRWRAQRASIVPTATALHRTSLEAYAAGDSETLRRICLGNHAGTLIAALDRRPSREGVRFTFEPRRSIWYPRLVSHLIYRLDAEQASEQAIVAISSRQRVERYVVGTGMGVPGSLRLQEKVEYVVLSRLVDMKSWVGKPWRIWGTVAPTSLEDYYRDKIATEKDMMSRAGWNKSSS